MDYSPDNKRLFENGRKSIGYLFANLFDIFRHARILLFRKKIPSIQFHAFQQTNLGKKP
jgi:hypothetical protein